MPTETEKPKNQLRLVIPLGRLSYPSLFQPTAMKGGKPKFSATILMNKKEHAAVIKQLEQFIERATLDKFQKAMKFKTDNICLHDGNDKLEKEGYGDDVMYLVAKSDTRPAVVDQNHAPLTEQDGKIYGGCYVDASVEIYAYHHKESGSKGVSAQLRAIRFRKDGQSFGGGGPVDAEKEFESVEAGDDDPNNY